jgi:hypothetical protein
MVRSMGANFLDILYTDILSTLKIGNVHTDQMGMSTTFAHVLSSN